MAFTPMDDTLSAVGDIISVDLITAVCTNLNFLLNSMPIGTVAPVFTGFPGVPNPDPNVWELADGHICVNVNSPIRGRHLPDMTVAGPNGPETPFIKGASSIGEAGNGNGPENYGGSHYPSYLAHSHGGSSGTYEAGNTIAKGDVWTTWIVDHAHGITTDLGTTQVLPVNVTCKFYVKVL